MCKYCTCSEIDFTISSYELDLYEQSVFTIEPQKVQVRNLQVRAAHEPATQRSTRSSVLHMHEYACALVCVGHSEAAAELRRERGLAGAPEPVRHVPRREHLQRLRQTLRRVRAVRPRPRLRLRLRLSRTSQLRDSARNRKQHWHLHVFSTCILLFSAAER